MKNLKYFLLSLVIALILFKPSHSQHLPLQIGNQWHYDMTFAPPGINYAAIAVDTTTISGKTYFNIERRHAYTGELLEITFDRLDGDSTYYRLRDGQDSIIINFNWSVGHISVIQWDSVCFSFRRLTNIFTRNVIGFNTQSYQFQIGDWCEGMQDTLWLLFHPEITRELGSYTDADGWLQGAIIEGVNYGTLYPLPVELTSFTAFVSGNDVHLNWSTATELNNSGFEVEKSSLLPPPYQGGGGEAGGGWEKIGFVPGHGTTTETQIYSFIDESVSSGKYQYRLKQIDYNGTFEYSDIVEVEVGLPTEFFLEQNYPNPFNPTTTIRYEIPESKFVTLKVYDVLGNKIATLVNEEKTAGSYEVEFDSNGITSGIYFYQLRAGLFVETRKMMLLR